MRNQDNLEKKILKKIYHWEIKKMVFNIFIKTFLIFFSLIIILATSNLFFSSVVKLKSFDFFNLFCEDFEVVSRYFFESFYAFSLEIPKEYLLIIFMTLIFFTFVLLTIFKNYYKTKNKIRSILKFLQTKI